MKKKAQLENVLKISEREKHQLNDSKAKFQFSFSKESRFDTLGLPRYIRKTNGPGKFYDLPSTINRRATSLGIGSRSIDGLRERLKVPAPGQYNAKLPDRNHSKTFCFGTSREKSKFCNMFYRWHNEEIPGPGTYSISEIQTTCIPSFHKKVLCMYVYVIYRGPCNQIEDSWPWILRSSIKYICLRKLQ